MMDFVPHNIVNIIVDYIACLILVIDEDFAPKVLTL